MEAVSFVLPVRVLITLLIVYLSVRIAKWYKNGKSINKFPGPPSRFIIGNWLDVMGTPGGLHFTVLLSPRIYCII